MASRRIAPSTSSKGQKVRRYSKALPVKLTQDQWEEMVLKSREKNKEVSKLRADKKEALKGFTDRIQTAEREEAAFGESVDKRTEERPVECEEIADFDTNRLTIRRVDTGEQLDHRAMTEAERAKLAQGTLIDDDA